MKFNAQEILPCTSTLFGALSSLPALWMGWVVWAVYVAAVYNEVWCQRDSPLYTFTVQCSVNGLSCLSSLCLSASVSMCRRLYYAFLLLSGCYSLIPHFFYWKNIEKNHTAVWMCQHSCSTAKTPSSSYLAATLIPLKEHRKESHDSTKASLLSLCSTLVLIYCKKKHTTIKRPSSYVLLLRRTTRQYLCASTLILQLSPQAHNSKEVFLPSINWCASLVPHFIFGKRRIIREYLCANSTVVLQENCVNQPGTLCKNTLWKILFGKYTLEIHTFEQEDWKLVIAFGKYIMSCDLGHRHGGNVKVSATNQPTNQRTDSPGKVLQILCIWKHKTIEIREAFLLHSFYSEEQRERDHKVLWNGVAWYGLVRYIPYIRHCIAL